ncbi:MAG: type II secretion system protein GspN [Alphaproteobacteria bacterium]|nr:type II secretion system protein GspN [Alphaproteobacteria bacterium]
MRTLLAIVATGFWCFLVFCFTLWLTFPSEPIADRIRYEVPRRLGDDFSADVGSAGPWWFGTSIADFRLYEDKLVEGEEARVPVAMLSRFKIALSPKSLLRRSPYVSGRVDMLDGSLTYEVGTTTTPKGGVGVTDVVLQSDGVPVGDLLALVPSFPGMIVGNLGIDLALKAGEEGMNQAIGHLSLTGEDLTVSDVDLPDIGPLGMDVPISSIDIAADVADGHAKITRGQIVSSLLTVDVSGDIALRDNLERSSIDLQIVVSHLGPELAAFESMMGSAKGSDGGYHFYCRGVVSRLNGRSCSSNDRGSANRARPARPSSGPIGADPGSDDLAIDGEGEDAQARTPQTDDERRRRRDEIRERLRQKREDRTRPELATPAATTPDDPQDDEGPFEDEEGFEDLIPEDILDEGLDGEIIDDGEQ